MAEPELARRFHQHVLAEVDHLKSRGYNPTRFLGMIAQYGSAVTVAKKLFADPRHTSQGFSQLWEMKELGRSVEFVANLPWFRDLFTDDELSEARYRLTSHEFPFEQRLTAAAADPPNWAAADKRQALTQASRSSQTLGILHRDDSMGYAAAGVATHQSIGGSTWLSLNGRKPNASGSAPRRI